MKMYVFTIVIFSILLSAKVYASDLFGGYLSANMALSQFGSPSAAIDDRYVILSGVDSLLGVNRWGATFGVHFEYDLVGQVTPLSKVNNTNSKGTISALGLGIRYFFSEQYYASLLLDFMGQYTFAEKTIGSEEDNLSKPLTLRLKIGKKLDLPYFITLDGDLRYSNYESFHIGGRDYDWTSRLWSVGVGLTWHFGKAADYVPEQNHVSVVDVPTAPVRTEEPQTQKITSERVQSKSIFSPYSSKLDSQMKQEIKDIADKLRENQNLKIEVKGYTDTSGTEKRNDVISKARAQAVRRYLISLGVKAERIHAVGMAASDPIADNETKEGRANNRRFEILLINEGGHQ